MAKSKPAPDSMDALHQFQSNMDQFAMKVGMTLQEVVKRLDKLEAKLAALGETQGVAWQSGWLPVKPINGKSEGKAAAYPGFDVKEHTAKLPEGAVPSLKGGWTYPTYL